MAGKIGADRQLAAGAAAQGFDQFAAMAAEIEQAREGMADIIEPLAQGGGHFALEEIMRRPARCGARAALAQQHPVEDADGIGWG